MTALEMVNGEYYAQGSDEYYAALQEITEPMVDLAVIIARELDRKHYPIIPGIIVRSSANRIEAE